METQSKMFQDVRSNDERGEKGIRERGVVLFGFVVEGEMVYRSSRRDKNKREDILLFFLYKASKTYSSTEIS